MESTNKSKKRIGVIIAIVVILLALIPVSVILAFVLSPPMYVVTTARWTEWDEENTTNVVTAMGTENTEERFRLYFQYYNVLHELGHGLIHYNNGVDIPIAEEESTSIIDEAVKNFNEWGLTFPVAYQMFNNDPNNNYSCPSKNFLGLIKKS